MRKEILKLREACYNCKLCPLGHELVDGLDPHVFASGKVDADVMCVAEAPGHQEQIKKIPLVGRSGEFFNEKILGKAGLTRNEVYVSNGLKCRPDANNRTPLAGEIEICRIHLDAEICLVKPNLIVSMGNVGLYSVCDVPGISGISKYRGQLRHSRLWSNEKQIPVLPLFHPAYCLRGSGLKEMEQDINLLKKLVYKIKKGEEIC